MTDERRLSLWRVLVRRAGFFVVPLIVFPTVALLETSKRAPTYRASADVLLVRDDVAGLVTGISDPTSNEDPQRFAATQIVVAGAPEVVDKVVREVGGAATRADIEDMTSIDAASDADVLTFEAATSNAALARSVADAYASAYVEYRRQLDNDAVTAALAGIDARIKQVTAAGQQGISDPAAETLRAKRDELLTLEMAQSGRARVIKPAAEAVADPIPVTRNVVLGVLGGLLIGLTAAFLAERADSRASSADEVAELLGTRLLGRVPRPRRSSSETGTPYAEGMRMARAAIEVASRDHPPRSLALLGARDGEGRSTTVAGLASAMGRMGTRVVVLDLALETSKQHELLNVPLSPGLAEVLRRECALSEATYESGVGTPGVAVVPAGARAMAVSDLLLSGRLESVLRELNMSGYVVLIDAPASLRSGDALSLAGLADAAVLVARAGRSRRAELLELRRLVSLVGVECLGVVVTNANADHVDLDPEGLVLESDRKRSSPAVDMR